MIRTFSELRKFKTFDDRYKYLKLSGVVGESTFGYDRYLNQVLYHSRKWKQTRNSVIIRDEGCDLGVEDYDIYDKIIIHHMNPITMSDIEYERDILYDPEGLICTSSRTHNAIHFGDESLLVKPLIERTKNDTCPWR